MLQKLYTWLESVIFPRITSFYANPVMILSTIFLFLPMIAEQSNVVLILLLNSWMNVGSFSTSQITLLNLLQTADEQEQRSIDTHNKVTTTLDDMNEILSKIHENTKDTECVVNVTSSKSINFS